MPILSLKRITKIFVQGQSTTNVLKNASLTLNEGEFCSLVGPSGCGKSTLLHICGLLEKPTSGEVIIDGRDCNKLSDAKATALRGQEIGFIYQFHHLLPEFSALENVMMPLLIAGTKRTLAKDAAKDILDEFSLSHRMNNIPSELSGGEQQRVAIARALIHQPKLLLADEPTGNLDEENAEVVFAQFLKITRNRDVSVLMVTHNLELAKKTDRILTINNGVVDKPKHDLPNSKSTVKAPRRRKPGTKSTAKKP